jgi:hypothetical protein
MKAALRRHGWQVDRRGPCWPRHVDGQQTDPGVGRYRETLGACLGRRAPAWAADPYAARDKANEARRPAATPHVIASRCFSTRVRWNDVISQMDVGCPLRHAHLHDVGDRLLFFRVALAGVLVAKLLDLRVTGRAPRGFRVAGIDPLCHHRVGHIERGVGDGRADARCASHEKGSTEFQRLEREPDRLRGSWRQGSAPFLGGGFSL